MSLPARTNHRRSAFTPAFTLVELLVVIGIIALLVGILLPTLSNARRAAQTIKCGAALREVGNVFQMYAIDSKGYYPPMRCFSPYRISFNSNPPTDYQLTQTYWMFFLGKYVAKTKLNKTSATATQADIEALGSAMKSVLWGCPTFVPISTAATDYRVVNGLLVVHTGYGYNGWPEYTSNYPAPSLSDINALGDSITPGLDANAVSGIDCVGSNGNWSNLSRGRWYKQRQYTNASERALLGDCRAFFLEALAAPNVQAISGQAEMNFLASGVWVGPSFGETTYDFYRHGKYPRKLGNFYDPKGGKVMYNILYADGHVKAAVTREEGIKAFRMRWPG